MTVSFQLYSARNFGPWPETLRRLADLGFGAVEGFGPLYDDPAATRAALDAAGLTMPSAHVALDAIEADPDAVVRMAGALGIRRVYAPYLAAQERPADAAGWTALGRRLHAAHGRLADAGLRFGWHNHDFEMVALPGGAVPMDLLLDAAPALAWEADIAWVVRGGADPLAWIAARGDRIATAHVKDIAPVGQAADEDGWADLGEGTVPWPTILPALQAAGCDLFVLEHDNPSDLHRFASRSLAAFRAMDRG